MSKLNTFHVEISTDNAAFTPTPGAELARILHRLAEKVADGRTGGNITDVNGTTVGTYWFEETE